MITPNTGVGLLLGGFVLVTLLSIILKGFSLWFSARNGQRNWFLVILVVNTLGLLEIVYLIWYRNGKKQVVSDLLSPNENKGTVAESKEGEN